MTQQLPCNKAYLKKITSDHKGSFATEKLLELFWTLYNHFGPQDWWPGETQLEIAIGAILTQNTNWQNVEKAITNLKQHGLLEIKAILEIPVNNLAQLIRPSGYYNIKAKRLKHFLEFIENEFGSDMEGMQQLDTMTLRQKLLNINGIGPETADSILLYAFEKPIFVVDAYTIRVMSQHDMLDMDACDYHTVQEIFMSNLPNDTCLFNEYHALFVRVGKEFCKKKKPRCTSCPLQNL